MRLLIMGPPGAGKGTQAERIAQHYGIPAISTGDIFRSEVKVESPLGLEVKRILADGGYVGDDVTNRIVAQRLAQPDASVGFLLDGYPRTLPQVDALDKMLTEHGSTLDAVLALEAETEEVVARLTKRAETEGRSDDTVEAIRFRQQKYADETAPLIAVYAERNLLVKVDGLGSMDDVSERIFDALAGVTRHSA